MEATQRGRPSVLQNCLMKSIIKSAVVLGSAMTGLSSGAGGVFTLDHSSMMVWAGAGAPQARATASAASDNRWRNRNMFFLPRFVAPRGPASAGGVKREKKPMLLIPDAFAAQVERDVSSSSPSLVRSRRTCRDHRHAGIQSAYSVQTD